MFCQSITQEPRYINRELGIVRIEWPRDYLTIDQGRLFVRRDYVSIFEQQGWCTFDDVFEGSRFRVVRQVVSGNQDLRDNCSLELPSPDGSRTTHAYFKRHYSHPPRYRRLLPFTRRPWSAPGLAEAHAVGACQRAGVRTMNVIAAGQSAADHRGVVRSLFMSEEIVGSRQADHFWPQTIAPLNGDKLNVVKRRRLLQAMGQVIRKLHQAGLFHRDLYWCHFFVAEAEVGHFDVWLIDLQRLHRRRGGLRLYPTYKDLGQFLFSAPPPPKGPTTEERRWWYACYRGCKRLGGLDHGRFALVQLRAALYQVKQCL